MCKNCLFNSDKQKVGFFSALLFLFLMKCCKLSGINTHDKKGDIL